MNTIESTLKKLSMLYDFNRKLHTFAIGTRGKHAKQAMEPTVAAVPIRTLPK